MKLFGSGGNNKHGKQDGESREQDLYIQKSGEYADGVKKPNLSGNKTKKTRYKGLKITLSVILILAVALGIAYKLFVVEPDIGGDQTLNKPGATQEPGSPPKPGETAPPPEEPTDNPNSNRRAGTYTFVAVAEDQDNGNTDTMMVGMLDTVNKKLNVVSIPRDTLVNVSWGTKKINTVYYNNSATTAEERSGYLKEALRDILGYTVDHYVSIDMEGFKVLVDTIDGVYYDVPIDMYYWDFKQNLAIEIPAGPQLLNGEDALKVMRYRYGYDDQDFGRMHTQQEFLKAAASQLLQLGNIATKIDEYAAVFKEYVDTSYSIQNIMWLGQEFLKLTSEDINFYTLPGNGDLRINGIWYVSLYIDEWLEMVNDYLNPFKTGIEITKENLNVLTYDGVNFYSTTGEIAGGINSFASN